MNDFSNAGFHPIVVDLASHRAKSRRGHWSDQRAEFEADCISIGDRRVSKDERSDRLVDVAIAPVSSRVTFWTVLLFLASPACIALGLYLALHH